MFQTINQPLISIPFPLSKARRTLSGAVALLKEKREGKYDQREPWRAHPSRRLGWCSQASRRFVSHCRSLSRCRVAPCLPLRVLRVLGRETEALQRLPNALAALQAAQDRLRCDRRALRAEIVR